MPAKILGDGTTVLNVFYELKTVRVYFKAEIDDKSDVESFPDIINPVEVKIYDNLQIPDIDTAIQVYKQNGGKKDQFLYWYSYQTKLAYPGVISCTPETTISREDGSFSAYYVAKFTTDIIDRIYYAIINETEDAGIYTYSSDSEVYGHYSALESDKKNWSLSASTTLQRGYELYQWRISSNHWDGVDDNNITWDEWHDINAQDLDSSGKLRIGYFDGTKVNVAEFKFRRLKHALTYYSDGKPIDICRLRYGTKIELLDFSKLPEHEGMIFGGWYSNPSFSGQPVTSLDMPAGDMHLYALWKRPDVAVTFDSANGTEPQTVTIPWDTKVGQAADPTREGYEFGGWYYQATSSSTPAPFSFDLNLEGDTRLVAAWKSKQIPVAYTVIHKTKTGEVLASWSGSGSVGQTVTELALDKADARRSGFRYVNASGITLDLAADATKNVYEFTYDNDTLFRYVVHFYDAETGLPVASDADFESETALLNYVAPHIAGYHILHGGEGYVSAREGGKELTFWYQKDAAPKPPAQQPVRVSKALTPIRTSTAPHTPKHMTTTPKSALPQTSDPTSTSIPAGVSLAGAGLALLGLRGTRKKNA